MSAVVEVWVGELAKLREKVLSRKPFLSKAKEGSEREQEEMEAQKKNTAVTRDNSGTMSEATMCLLMDRFVPW
ncbi:hypothetical protein LR48_Vigan08g167400 [Vigna angularis]|uniref:Uncharacterized protein n=2 Tax=Phaseolus angularis TaxID=3914 RepID=A0A0L9V7C8_PHAAN|nr:uncharacterized protein HKW66_Vig0139130 [Vigna angularis]KOM50847.1 hypothetical protein LR48_Vigan08g167400 [Vigna angularis]BAT90876.1 hypothetical protein VIGAN_06216700 [Vigna angularis var. angularis]